jgi:hypothetical protein
VRRRASSSTLYILLPPTRLFPSISCFHRDRDTLNYHSIYIQSLYQSLFTPCLALTCSGNGGCVYTDPSGNKLQSCTIFDAGCTATCFCPNFGGKDCSLSIDARKSRSDVRWVLTQLDATSIIFSTAFFTSLTMFI